MKLDFFIPSGRVGSRGIPLNLPGRNDLEGYSRASAAAAARVKKEEAARIARIARRAMEEQAWRKPQSLVTISFIWHETGRPLRDQDNVRGYEKIILDALKSHGGVGAIEDDSCKWIKGFTRHSMVNDKRNPGVRVIMMAEWDRDDVEWREDLYNLLDDIFAVLSDGGPLEGRVPSGTLATWRRRRDEAGYNEEALAEIRDERERNSRSWQ